MDQKDETSKEIEARVAKLVKQAYSEPKLLFHNGGTKMFLRDGRLQEEPEESLVHLIRFYVENSYYYSGFRRKLEEARKPYQKQKMENGEMVTYIDYDEWERLDNDSFWDFALADFNGYNGLDMQQWDIDLKIAHIYARKGVEIPSEQEHNEIYKRYLEKKAHKTAEE
jgi:hypothetical protein